MYILLIYSKQRTIKTMKTGEPPPIMKQSISLRSHRAIKPVIKSRVVNTSHGNMAGATLLQARA